MHKFKATLIDWGLMDDPPAWMAEKLADSRIEYTVVRSITQEALLRNATQADAIVTGGHRRLMVAENMDALPNLVALVKLGSGVDNVDVDAATERGIIVANTPDAVTETVSDHAIALLLAAVRKIPQQDRLIREGVWSIKRATPGRHLRGATLGLVGFGDRCLDLLLHKAEQVLEFDAVVDPPRDLRQERDPFSHDHLVPSCSFSRLDC